jgi:hypothetical protein
MAEELLKAKEDTKELGINWQESFLRRHPNLKSVFVTGLDKERFLAQDREIFEHFFNLYRETKAKFSVHDDDIYNMDEKGCLICVIGKMRVILSRHEADSKYMTQCGNREWVSLIECISVLGRTLPPLVIFKAKQHMKS